MVQYTTNITIKFDCNFEIFFMKNLVRFLQVEGRFWFFLTDRSGSIPSGSATLDLGYGPGSATLDLGYGPGFATLDLEYGPGSANLDLGYGPGSATLDLGYGPGSATLSLRYGPGSATLALTPEVWTRIRNPGPDS